MGLLRITVLALVCMFTIEASQPITNINGTCPDGMPPVYCFASPCQVTTCNQPYDHCEENYCGGCHAIFYDAAGKVMVCSAGSCPDGTDPVNCLIDPCDLHEYTCSKPYDHCEANYCGGCNAVLYDADGAVVDCPGGSCPDGSYPVNCLVDPCDVATCNQQYDHCEANYCGGCNAVFYDVDGAVVECSAIVEKDPHLTTFDGVKYNFQGLCTYVLTQDCRDVTKPSFQITADFRGKYSELREKPLTRIEAVNVIVGGIQLVRILKNNAFLIKGELFTNSSAVIGNAEGTVNVVGARLRVELNDPKILLVWTKTIRGINISLRDSMMHGTVCGLLGNNNGNPDDEFLKPNGDMLSRDDIYEFGDSWMVPGSCDYN